MGEKKLGHAFAVAVPKMPFKPSSGSWSGNGPGSTPPYFWPTGKVLEVQFSELVLSKDSSHKVAAETFELCRFVNTAV